MKGERSLYRVTQQMGLAEGLGYSGNYSHSDPKVEARELSLALGINTLDVQEIERSLSMLNERPYKEVKSVVDRLFERGQPELASALNMIYFAQKGPSIPLKRARTECPKALSANKAVQFLTIRD